MHNKIEIKDSDSYYSNWLSVICALAISDVLAFVVYSNKTFTLKRATVYRDGGVIIEMTIRCLRTNYNISRY